MSLYPSLEDMKVDQLEKSQYNALLNSINQSTEVPCIPKLQPMALPRFGTLTDELKNSVYPALDDYMGLEMSVNVISANIPEYLQVPNIAQNRTVPTGTNTQLIAPISGQSLSLFGPHVPHSVRELTLCKGKDGKVGVRVKAINKGIFVCLVIEKSPAALAGLRFGDQILQINDITVAGFTMDKVHEILRKCPINGIKVIVRDRPFERSITLHKDSVGCIGFQFKNGKITAIVKDSSAAKNGVLTEHQLLEVDGQNVVGMKDKQIIKIIEQAGNVVTITVIPSFIYDHMVKQMAGSLLKGLMDHSIPTL